MKILITILSAAFILLNNVYAQQADNRVSVLHSGYVQPIEGKDFLPGAQPDGARKVASTITLVEGKNIVLIADPGMAAVGVWDSVLEQLEAKRIGPGDVTHIFISHHHPDHITQLGIFPNATLVDFWATYKNDVWSDHPDNYELAQGIKVIRTPGHTDEDASLLVDTREGIYALTHLWWSPGYEPKEDPLAEDTDGIEKSRELVLNVADWIVPGHGPLFRNNKKQSATINDAEQKALIKAVQSASDGWIAAFNEGDAVAVASFYEQDAVMSAKPFGMFAGVTTIQSFWEDLISKGFSEVEYIKPKIEVINSNAAVISSKWKMNHAHGVITKELWVLQANGQAKLRIDKFEILGEN